MDHGVAGGIGGGWKLGEARGGSGVTGLGAKGNPAEGFGGALGACMMPLCAKGNAECRGMIPFGRFDVT